MGKQTGCTSFDVCNPTGESDLSPYLLPTTHATLTRSSMTHSAFSIVSGSSEVLSFSVTYATWRSSS